MSAPSTSDPRARSGRARGWVVFALKVAVAVGLIAWLVRSGALDFGALRILVERPWLGAANLTAFALGGVLMTLRWRALLGAARVTVPVGRLLQLQTIALFFNAVVPGNVGGDVVKSLYVARDAEPSKRATILLVVFVERVVGLAGLVVIAGLVMALGGPALWGDPALRPFIAAIAFLGAVTVFGPLILVLSMRRAGARVEAWTSGPTRLARLLSQLVAAMRLLSSDPKHLAVAFGLSMALHGISIALFTVLARAISGEGVPYSTVASVFPLGLLSQMLPISPAGLGVGHVAFEQLLGAVGLAGGATIFNVYFIGQLAPCVVGIVPYLALRRGGVPTAGSEMEKDRAGADLSP